MSYQVPIYEPGLDVPMHRNVEAELLSCALDLGVAIEDADGALISAGTPTRLSNGHTDLTRVMTAAGETSEVALDYLAVITKSFVPLDLDVVSNPEFLREGSAIDDSVKFDRVVTKRAEQVMPIIYRPSTCKIF
ncbi:hypothetical protein [Sagittula sp. NFXS13]|uniref:hypothetical protein n=1 Tax=Sagittula sp. NFXS13 TaxID=2819095 RepID=UPI0032DE695C